MILVCLQITIVIAAIFGCLMVDDHNLKFMLDHWYGTGVNKVSVSHRRRRKEEVVLQWAA